MKAVLGFEEVLLTVGSLELLALVAVELEESLDNFDTLHGTSWSIFVSLSSCNFGPFLFIMFEPGKQQIKHVNILIELKLIKFCCIVILRL